MLECTLMCMNLLPLSSLAECKRAAVELPVTISGTRALIDVKINNQDVRLLVDSGAFFSMISNATAQELKLRVGPAPYGFTMRGVGGSASISLATAKVFTIGNVDLRNVEFLVGGSESGNGSAGLLGQNFLANWNVEYDLAKGSIRLFRDTGCSKQFLAYWVAQSQLPYTVTSIEQVTPRAPHAIGQAYINGQKIKVIFDSGAFKSVLSLKAAARAGVKVDSPGVIDGGLTSGIGRNMTTSYIAPFASFKFADGEEIKNARLRIADINIEIADMLIGADFFLSHRIFVANTQRKLYFTYNGGPVFDLRTKPTSSEQAPAASAQASGTKPQESAGKPAVEAAEDAGVLARRGAASAGRGDYQHALDDLTRAVELSPSNSEYVYQRGEVFLAMKEPQKASGDFDQALALRPDYVAALMSRAALRIDAKDIADALPDLEAVDKIVAKQADVRFRMAFDYLYADLLPQAITQYDIWIAAHGDDARMAIALSARCKARAMLGLDLPAALRDCNAAISRSDKLHNPDFLDNLALLRFRLGDYDKSIGEYDAALKLRPHNAWSLYGRGLAKLKKNTRNEGQADLEEAVKISPGVADAYKSMGIAP